MATIGSLVVNLVANTAGFSSGMQKGVKDAKSFEARIKTVSGVVSKFAATLGIAGGAFSTGAFLKGAMDEAIDAENTFKKLETAVKSTGYTAGFTAHQLSDMAAELQKTTTFADDTTKKAQALLLTFTNVKGDVFTGGIKAAQDMAAFLGTDLTDAVTTVGKALNDPARGMMLLTKAGAEFNKEQRQIIKRSKETGDSLAGQNVILDVLARKYGGQAAAAVDTFSGAMQQLNNEWADLKEHIGNTITLPLGKWLLDNVKALNSMGIRLPDLADALTAPVRLQANFLKGLIGDFADLSPAVTKAGDALKMFKFNWSSLVGPTAEKAFNGKGFAAAFSALNAAQFIGKNRANVMGDPGFQARTRASESRKQRIADAAAAVGFALGLGGALADPVNRVGGRPMARKSLASPFAGSSSLATNFSRGSVEDYLARTKNGPMATFTDAAKKQLSAAEKFSLAVDKWDPFGGQAFPNTVTIGGA